MTISESQILDHFRKSAFGIFNKVSYETISESQQLDHFIKSAIGPIHKVSYGSFHIPVNPFLPPHKVLNFGTTRFIKLSCKIEYNDQKFH